MKKNIFKNIVITSLFSCGILWAPFAEAQFFIPPKKEVASKEAPKNDSTDTSKKQRPVAPKKNKGVKKTRPAEDWQSKLDAQEERQLALETALNELKKQLAQTNAEEGAPSLSAEQQNQIVVLEQTLDKKQQALKQLETAVDNGLDEGLVRPNMDALRNDIATLKENIQAVKNNAATATSKDDEIALLSQKVNALERKLAMQQREPAQATSPVAPAKEEETPEAESQKTSSQSLMDSLGELLPVEIFAFGDFQYYVQEDGPDDFALGQLELDLAQDLAETLTITAAIAYDSEAASLGIGAFTIDGRIVGSDGAHLKHNDRIKSLGLILGQFDVPFGVDYMQYASIDRRLVTGPIAVDTTHEGWNDLGAQLYLTLSSLNAIVYAVNGFGYTLEVDDGMGGTVEEETDATMAMGGRLGVLPTDFLEVGGSLATFFASGGKVDQLLVGGDVVLTPGNFDLRGEYLFQRQGIMDNFNLDNHAMYGTVQYDFDPVFVTARYSAAWPDGAGREDQLSLGAGVSVMENAEIRMEYSTNLEEGGSVVFLQLAGGSAWQPTGMRR